MATSRIRTASVLAESVLLLILLFALVASRCSASTYPAAEPRLVQEWMDRAAAFFEAHPEMRIPPSSGYKHFLRAKRFLDARTIDGVLPTAADRYKAWQTRQARQAAMRSVTNGWFSMGPANISGRILDIEFHPTNPQIVYAAAASGGLWISTNGGNTWRTTTDGLPSIAIGAICVLPQAPNVVLVGTGDGLSWLYSFHGTGVWKSTDAGESWAQTSLNHVITEDHGFYVMEANPTTGTILAGANDGLWRSTDQGETWTRILAGGHYYDVKWKPGSPSRVYAAKGDGASGNGIKVSTDDGLTWTAAGAGQPPSSSISKTKLAVTPANPSVIYAHYGSSQTWGTLGIYRSTNDGATWVARNTSLNVSGTQGMYAVTIAVAPDDPQRVIAGGIELYLSLNGGTSFTETGDGDPLGDETAVHWDHHAVAWEPGSSRDLWVGTDGGAWRSTDAGATWSPRRDGLVTTQYYDLCLDAQDAGFTMGGSQDNGLTWTEDADSVWFPSTLVADGFACFVEPLSPTTIYSEWQFGGHVKSIDRGQSWHTTMDGLSGNSMPFAPLDLDPNRPGHLYTSTSSGVFRTVNGQALWVQVSTHTASWVSISPVNGDVVWTADASADQGPVRVTTNDGGSWIQAGAYDFPVGNETTILAHPTNAATAFVTFAGYAGVAHVARTTDLGATWQDVSGDFPPDPANTMVVDPGDPEQWIVGTDTGVWRSDDGGSHWEPLGVDFPDVMVHDLEIQQAGRKLVAITYGRGAWETDLANPAGVPDAEALRHLELMLDPPVPNPVTGSTSVRFASRMPGPATLEVYDVAGRRVARLATTTTPDGIIRITKWVVPDGTPSGIYLLALRSGNTRLTRTLVVLK